LALETTPMLVSFVPSSSRRASWYSGNIRTLVGPLLSHASAPPAAAVSFLSLPPLFSTSNARCALVERCPFTPLLPRLHELLPLSPTAVEQLWRWIRRSPATPQEADQHWQVLHGALLTQRRQYKMALAPDESCLHCGEQDSLLHALRDCPFSTAYWSTYSDKALLLARRRLPCHPPPSTQLGTPPPCHRRRRSLHPPRRPLGSHPTDGPDLYLPCGSRARWGALVALAVRVGPF
ncbi:hypothetical protein JCM8547_003009, partial [Rhodosporidiobolus lusitaniae]